MYQSPSQAWTALRHSRLNRSLKAYHQFKSQNNTSPLSIPELQQLKSVYMHGICGRSSCGDIIMADRIGCIKPNELSKVVEQDTLVAYMNWRLLRVEEMLEDGQRVVCVVDLSGKIMQLAGKKVMGIVNRVVENCQLFFPCMLNKLIFVNTPMLFDTIWAKASAAVHPDTHARILMMGQDQSLQQHISAHQLPWFVGGALTQQDLLNNQKLCDNVYVHQQQQYKQQQKQQQEQGQEQEQEQEEEQGSSEEGNLQSLKLALSGLKTGGSNLMSVSVTPLNTQADDRN